MKINTCHLVLKTNKKVKQNSSKFRGYIGREFDKYPILHNHYGNNKFLYSYPLVQYQIIDGQPSILGIEEGADILNEISSKIRELKLGDSYYRVDDHYLYYNEYEIKATNRLHQYRFLTPWLALNSKNYNLYKDKNDWKEKKEFLNSILVGNILSMSKGLGIIVNKRLHVHSKLDYTDTEYKNVRMNAFTGEFKVNFKIPDFFGFGKGTSQGFGTVVPVHEESE